VDVGFWVVLSLYGSRAEEEEGGMNSYWDFVLRFCTGILCWDFVLEFCADISGDHWSELHVSGCESEPETSGFCT
jgi:hypothetical protein